MHPSRMRTARLLPVSPSMHCCAGGVSAPMGGSCLPLVLGGCILACNGVDTLPPMWTDS